jgi:hypothetical protein
VSRRGDGGEWCGCVDTGIFFINVFIDLIWAGVERQGNSGSSLDLAILYSAGNSRGCKEILSLK